MFFFLHFATPNLAIVRGGPSSTPRHTKFMKGVALEEERAENKVWEKKDSLAESCHHPHLSYSKRSQEENGLFFLVSLSGGISNSPPIDLFHFRRTGTDSPSQKNQSWELLLKYHQLMISSPWTIFWTVLSVVGKDEPMSTMDAHKNCIFARLLSKTPTNYCSHQ